MAGDWIKMRVGLQYGDPHVVRILSALRTHGCVQFADRLRVVGALHAVWCVFDQYSADAQITYTPDEMDLFLGWPGFTQAMIDVGWLEFDGAKTLIMNNPESHNGKTAKRRASEALRQQTVRSRAYESTQTVRNPSVPREDKGFLLNPISNSVSKNQIQNPKSNGKFQKPTLEEIRAEVAARGSRIDPESFFAFYESKGWKVGNQPMKSWRACIVTWEKRASPHRDAVASGNAALPMAGQCSKHPESGANETGRCWGCYREAAGGA